VLTAKKIVRIRDNGICQRCGRSQGALHCSHVYPEGKYHGMSAMVSNMKLLCFNCHFYWWHKNPIEANEWFKKTFPDRFKKLRLIAQKTIKTDWAKELQKLKEELTKIQ
jgi:5-methylcytosine-specific restriction endonuclease McrA